MTPSDHITFIQRRINVDVTSTLIQRCFNVACQLGQVQDNVHLIRHVLKKRKSEEDFMRGLVQDGSAVFF